MSTGIGPDNIDIVMNELDALVNVRILATRTVKSELTSLNIVRALELQVLCQADIPCDSFVMSQYGLGFDQHASLLFNRRNFGN